MDKPKVKRWENILHFFLGGTAHGKECECEVGDGEGISQLHNHTNHNINNMIIMELLTLKKNKKQLAYRRF